MEPPRKRLPPAEALVYHFDRSRLRGVFQGLWNSYSTTFHEIKKRGGGKENIALRPQLQHANTQKALREVAERYQGDGIASREVPNENGSDWHVEITAGTVVLTDSYVRSLKESPRYAAYREILAGSNDLSLFSAPYIDVETPLYALLVHGFEAKNAEERLSRIRPDFAIIYFPVEQARTFALTGINLFEMFPDVVRVRGPREDISDRAMPDLRDESFGDDA